NGRQHQRRQTTSLMTIQLERIQRGKRKSHASMKLNRRLRVEMHRFKIGPLIVGRIRV
ncbi:hypothetical protein PIB30_115383, partial [Stylosanthes scabra]|nr:hypothetical protein [Stylosanthes scabra]